MQATLTIHQQHPLSRFCTFGIGGPARYFLEVNTIAEMQQALHYASVNQLSYMILGKGSNCLFDDRGYDGLVILNKVDFIQNTPPNCFYVGAGYSFSRLGTLTARKGWAGLEFASGIPGSVGGAVYMNAGANGGETSHTLSAIEFVCPTGELLTFARHDLDFAYRSSPFQRMAGAIVSATFVLAVGEEARKTQIDIVKYRKTTQPYGDASAGCVFRNPPDVSAGSLIERSGLKGKRIGGAMVSKKHANFIVNSGGATARDVLSLQKTIQEHIRNAIGVELTSEIIYIPYQGICQGAFHE